MPWVVKGDTEAEPSVLTDRDDSSSGCKANGDAAPRSVEPTDIRGSNGDGSVEKRHTSSLVIEEAMRVYKNSSEKKQNSKMQPCPVALTPEEYSSEELLGCRTDMLVEPRALLGSLQPCVHCYKLYGAKASVEVCRLTKRHLASNWDHPHFVSPAQIQDALLTCFQSKKKWYYGVVSNYQAISSKVTDVDLERSGEYSKVDEKEKKITYYTNQFRIDYDDGDFQTVPPHELIEMLIETGPGSKLDGRKAITTTPLVKMLSPELRRANRQVNQLVRETNKKGCVVDSDSDEE
ncbi:uncharacterized protein EMH_0061660 [Eimeria mitis]|uniref:Uncharacterized protein n=1 Tax=Eimeria mitis TaxID=44415 RepID=U6K3G4_9EIME|nr:uncharacterized protein EMH_0061660 [Eimeria mitis]CDJ30837.1 hypothetical protein EMH_0061660 [Eimeria mitis]